MKPKVHSDNSYICWPASQTLLRFRPNKFEIACYQEDDHFRDQLRYHLSKLPIIPWKTQSSLMYVLLTYEASDPWRERYSDTYRTIMQLEQILRLYCEVDGTKIHVSFKKEAETVFSEFTKGLDEDILQHYYDTLPDCPGDVGKFRALILKTTFDYIHLLEKCLYKFFVDSSQMVHVDLEKDYLTPMCLEQKKIKLTTQGAKAFDTVFHQFFREKRMLVKQYLCEKGKRQKMCQELWLQDKIDSLFQDDKKIWEDYLALELFQSKLLKLKK